MKSYDVVVIGGGPAGSYVAGELAGVGYGVVVLERKERVGEQVCCTGIIGQECVSSFGIDSHIILRQVNSARLFSPSGRLLRLWREKTQACIIDRPAFNTAMVNRAQGKGAEYKFNCLVKSIEVNNDKARVTCEGEGLNLEAKAVVIAAGFNSGLTEGLGLGKVGDFVMGAQAEVETVGVDEVEVYFGQEVAPGFFAWLVPVLPNRALAGLLSRHSPGLYLRKLISSLLAQGKIVSSDVKLSYGGIPLKPLPKTYGKRLVVVGDAAGQVKPTTGGGIYYGLLCAAVAVDNLRRSLENDNFSARSLAGYEREWKKRLGGELRTGYWARKFYERLSDRQVDGVFDIIISNGIDEALLRAENLSFDWHGEVVLKLLGYRVMSRALEVMKIPFHPRRKA